MKTEQFSKVEHLLETTCDEIDKLYDGKDIISGSSILREGES